MSQESDNVRFCPFELGEAYLSIGGKSWQGISIFEASTLPSRDSCEIFIFRVFDLHLDIYEIRRKQSALERAES
jgi:hypothetical protein